MKVAFVFLALVSVLASTRGDLGEAKLSCKPDMKAPLTTAS